MPSSTQSLRPAERRATPPAWSMDPTRPTRVAVVGAGYIADYHLEILAKLAGDSTVELVAVCDRDLDRAQRAAQRFGAAQAVGSIAELAEHDVQIAHVLVPPDLHVRVASEVLEAGIGVFLEKPFALSSADAERLSELARERGLPLGVNHNNVFHPSFQRLLEAVKRGDIGRVEHVQVTLSVPLRQLDAGDFSHWMFREPRNIVFEQAPHPFSQLVELVGGVQKMRVSLLGSRELNPGQVFHDRWLLAATAERGTAEVYLAFGQDFTRSTLQVLGTDGSLEADLFHDHFSGERKSKWLEFWNSYAAGMGRARSVAKSARRNLKHYGLQTLGLGSRQDAFYAGMRDSIGSFHEALRRGEAPPCGAEHGVQVTAWCDAAVAELAEPAPPVTVEPSTADAREGEVCVLGASGFIGRQTLAALLSRGIPVTAVARRTHSLAPIIDEASRDGRLRLLLADLSDREALARAVRGARVVVHLATGGGNTWEAVQRAMVDGTRTVGEVCLDEGVERLVYVSSTAALYLGHDAGAEVSDAVGPDPEPEARPLYARGKIAAEEALMKLHRERGLGLNIVRPAVVVGPGTPLQHSGLGLWVRDNHCVGWGKGDTPVPLVLASDVADALARLALHTGDELDGKALNLASAVQLTARDTIEIYRKYTGRDFHFHGRSLWLSQSMEIGKWIVKKLGRRKDAVFPSYRDLKSRGMVPRLTCERARDVLGWQPCDDGQELLRRFLEPS